ncbi:NFACT family protein [Candidatus Woesearchaeota archaeon]|nr:NFACT family protein [Candidatus Woesearchaeota archaeon]
MKQLSSLEIGCVVKELQTLVGSKLNRVYQPTKEEVVLSFHKTSHGKIMLRVIPTNALFITNFKKESPKNQFSFCMFLRKRIQNARLMSILQKNFERIVEFCFETKEAKYYLIVELFSKGNIILCDEKFVILSALSVQHWKDRIIKAGETYKYPPKASKNIFELSLEEFKKDVKESVKESLVKILAADFGLGGLYAEEICKRAGIDKNKKEHLEKVYEVIQTIRELEIKASLYKEEAAPFEMAIFEEEPQKFPTFNEALNSYYSRFEYKKEEKDVYQKKIAEQEHILGMQKEQLANFEKSIEENREKGDLIYKNYGYVKEAVEAVRMARNKKISWEEIAAKLKTKKIEALGKEGKLILELT